MTLERSVFLRQLLALSSPFHVVTQGSVGLRDHWTLGPRVIRDHLIYGLESGCVVGEIGGRRYELRPAGLLWVQPGVEHRFALAPGCTDGQVTYCRFYLGRGRRPLRIAEDVILSDPDPQGHGLLRALVGGEVGDSELDEVRRCGLLSAVACHLMSGQTTTNHLRGLRPAQRQAAVAFIQKHTAERICVADVARHVQLNAAYFASQFKISFGVTPRRYITTVRVHTAAALLAGSNLAVKQVATQLGYQNIYFFSRQFKQVMRLSPRQWRCKRT